MHQFEVGGEIYGAGKVPARSQHHLVRRLAPFASALMALKDQKGIAENPAVFITPMAEALAKMSDEDSDFIFDTCFAVVKRKQGEAGWVGILAPGTSKMMFDDIDLMNQYFIVAHVLQDSLGPFVDAVKRAFSAAVTAGSNTTPS